MAGKLKGAQRYFYLKDHLGSTRAIVNGNGTVLAGYDYDAWGYLLENRSLNSDSIKFKYTGKERDKESLYDYFGARYYDARIGRWGQVEPLLKKYPQISPYVYSLDNPLVIIDPNGLDPIREQFGNINSVRKILEASIGKTFFDLGKNVFGKSAGEKSRYVYTKERGILDLPHFFAAANQSNLFGFQPAINQGIVQEFAQLIGKYTFGLFDKESAFNPEDLTSNFQGAVLGKILESNIVTEENIDKVIEFLNSLVILEPNDPSISETEVYIPSLSDYKSGIRLPLRYTIEPYYGEKVGFNNK